MEWTDLNFEPPFVRERRAITLNCSCGGWPRRSWRRRKRGTVCGSLVKGTTTSREKSLRCIFFSVTASVSWNRMARPGCCIRGSVFHSRSSGLRNSGGGRDPRFSVAPQFGSCVANPEPLPRPRIGFATKRTYGCCRKFFDDLWNLFRRNQRDLPQLIRTLDQPRSAVAESHLDGLLVYNRGIFSRRTTPRQCFLCSLQTLGEEKSSFINYTGVIFFE